MSAAITWTLPTFMVGYRGRHTQDVGTSQRIAGALVAAVGLSVLPREFSCHCRWDQIAVSGEISRLPTPYPINFGIRFVITRANSIEDFDTR
jgi:hypothetical protein